MASAISWFEIPTTDLERATKFYETILEIKLIPMEMPDFKMRMFPVADMMNDIGGALVQQLDFYKCSATDGALIYLNANPDVQLVLDRVKAAGGQVVVPKTQISKEYGYMGVFIDTEGNRVALHSIP